MATPKIPDLDSLLAHFLGPNRTIKDHETTRLTTVGENYGSLMLALHIHLQGEKEVLEAVAKVPPPGEFIKMMFNTPVTFLNEISFYRDIVPELKKWAKEEYVDCYPQFYGGRLSLEDTDWADDDAVLILENLKVSGYKVIDRTTGFDLSGAKAALKALAKLHAVPLAMKLLSPDVFREKIKSRLVPFVVFPLDHMLDGVIEKIRNIVDSVESCKQYSSKVEEVLRASTQFTLPKNSPEYMREPFSTIIHTDAWVNNFMVKFEDGEAVDCKIVDFQLYEYGSPARDVIFFIFSSIQIPVLQKHYDDLIEWYHRNLVDILTDLKCDPSPFSMDEFRKEIKLVSRECEFFQSMIMLEPIFATKDAVKELDEYKEEDMTEQRQISPKYREKVAFIVTEFLKKGLI